jgi:hypothetical protein
MSIISTTANYGGKMPDNQQGIKQFYVAGPNVVSWVYRRLTGGTLVITPADSKKPVYIDNDLIVKKNMYVDGSLYNPSDEKLKESIEVISQERFNDLFTLNPIYFSYKNDKEKSKHFGLLAQDVEKIFPELVNTMDKGYKAVNYQELIPIMLAKMKQMQSEIDELKQLQK